MDAYSRFLVKLAKARARDIESLERIVQAQAITIQGQELVHEVRELRKAILASTNRTDMQIRVLNSLRLDLRRLLGGIDTIPDVPDVFVSVYGEILGENDMELAVFKLTVPEIAAPSVVVSREVSITIEGQPSIEETLSGLAGKVYEDLKAADGTNVAVVVTTVDHHGGRNTKRQALVIHNTAGPDPSPDVVLEVTGEVEVADPAPSETPAPAPTDTPAPADAPVEPAPADAPVEPAPAPADAPVEPAPADAPVEPAPVDPAAENPQA